MCLWCLSVTCRIVCVSLVSENKTGHLSSREEKSTLSLQKREEENEERGKGEKYNIYCQKVMVEPSTDWDREMLLFSDFFLSWLCNWKYGLFFVVSSLPKQILKIGWEYLGNSRAVIHFLKSLAKHCNFTNVLFYYKGRGKLFFQK